MKTTPKRAPRPRNKEPRSDPAVSYEEFKEHEGQRYVGMRIGRSHTWRYEQGEWKETKVTPDLWRISYAVTKRRAGKAPEGSGVPVGTEYHWYILAHQNVKKLNANDYTTSMTGMKFKIAHKRAASGKWSATLPTQRKRMIAFLRDVIADLEAQQPKPGVRTGLPEKGELERPARPPRAAARRARVRRWNRHAPLRRRG